jgi:hypothetical protein
LIDLYWNIGEIIGGKISAAEWGDGIVAQLAGYIARTQPALRGFTRLIFLDEAVLRRIHI